MSEFPVDEELANRTPEQYDELLMVAINNALGGDAANFTLERGEMLQHEAAFYSASIVFKPNVKQGKVVSIIGHAMPLVFEVHYGDMVLEYGEDEVAITAENLYRQLYWNQVVDGVSVVSGQ